MIGFDEAVGFDSSHVGFDGTVILPPDRIIELLGHDATLVQIAGRDATLIELTGTGD